MIDGRLSGGRLSGESDIMGYWWLDGRLAAISLTISARKYVVEEEGKRSTCARARILHYHSSSKNNY